MTGEEVVSTLTWMFRPIKNDLQDCCSLFGSFVQRFCDHVGVACQMIECYVEGAGHIASLIDGRVIDFTLSQFLPHAPWPYVQNIDNREVGHIYQKLRQLTPGETDDVIEFMFEIDPRGVIFKDLLKECLRLYTPDQTT